MTALIDTLFQFEKYLDLVPDSLLPYAEADEIGGFHPDAAQAKWGAGAIWDVEGRALYALIRALKPQTIVEIGSGTGCSTTHIALALHNNFKADEEMLKDGRVAGHIVTIDRGNTPRVPDFLTSYYTAQNGDALEWLAQQPDASIDFILEDADHSEALCHAIGELAKTKLKPGGVLLFHDAAHFGVGHDVCMGYDLAGLDFRVFLTDPSDCGWGVWKRPANKGIGYLIEKNNLDEIGEELTRIYGEADASPVIDTTVLQAQEEPNATWENMMHQAVIDAMTDDSGEPHPDMTTEPIEKPKRPRKKAAK